MEIDLKQLLDAYSVLGRIADKFYEPSSVHWDTLLEARKLLVREMHRSDKIDGKTARPKTE